MNENTQTMTPEEKLQLVIEQNEANERLRAGEVKTEYAEAAGKASNGTLNEDEWVECLVGTLLDTGKTLLDCYLKHKRQVS